MSSVTLGYIIGVILAIVLVPALIVFVAQSWKRNPKFLYILCAVLAIVMCVVTALSHSSVLR